MIEKIFMGIAFVLAGLSTLMFWGQGFHAWIWQIITMIWIFNCYIKQKTIDRFNK